MSVAGPRVLVVDDRDENRLALRAVLEPLGLELVEAASGEAALKALLEGDFAVVLLDVRMPGLDGFETAAIIKGRPRTRDTPIIFLTAAQGDVDQVFAAYEAGAVDFLPKPFDPHVLRAKVAVFADLDRQRRALARSDELVRTAFDAAPSGMALCDLDGVVLRANPALAELAGPDAVPGTAVTALLTRGGDPLAGLLGELRAGTPPAGGPLTFAAQVAGATGVPVPVRTTATVVQDAHGDAAQVLVTLEDERDRQIASTLQRALLPERLPSVPGLSVAAHVSPGGHGTQVGGDWYDAIALPGGRLGVVVGDVAGRGVEAAARMGELRSVARAYALEGHDPVELVERMNGYHAALGADLMTTLLFAVFEVDRGLVRVVSAGHPPLLVHVPGQEPQVVDPGGPPLGVLDTWRYAEQTVELPQGSHVLLYTDGLVERRGEALDSGLERLQRAFLAHEGDVAQLCSALVHDMGAADADDDVTCVAVRMEELLGAVAHLTLDPDAATLARLRRVVRRWLAEAGADDNEQAQLVMAVNEALQNAIEHGTGFARTTVDLDLEARAGEVVLKVRDAGRRDRGASDPDRGRGIELMRALADEVTLELASHGSTVRLRRLLSCGASTLPAAGAPQARVASSRT